MYYFIFGFIMFVIVVYVFYGVIFESKGQLENKNDERWQAIVAKSDSIALISFYILATIMAFITLSGDIFRRFEWIRETLSKENLFELYKYYTLFSLCIIFSIRTLSLKYYNKKI